MDPKAIFSDLPETPSKRDLDSHKQTQPVLGSTTRAWGCLEPAPVLLVLQNFVEERKGVKLDFWKDLS